jgi:Putative peptidoglycan binding domain
MTTLIGDEPELQLGDSGEHVTQLQERLRGLQLLDRYPDGAYDDATESAVRQLQQSLGHESDGRVSQYTWQALDEHMLANGLEYNHYAGAGQQHWDLGEPAPSTVAASPSWQDAGSGTQNAFDPQAHQVSEEGYHYWDGVQWQPMSDADHLAHAEHQAQQTYQDTPSVPEAHQAAAVARAEEPLVIPHIDDIHPAIREDERFAAFHDFLRERGGQ